ncbi:auxin-responsive protein IAA13-like isoform X2 [Bidens hawaiensis]|uniref:auxin-responsive protein IAA13-like isoform X2 n=1 Tax=Bidens hawaiensis TaxID=980011 RepID=UPI0040495735
MDGDGDSGGVSSDESTTAGSILAGKNNQDKGVSPEVSSPFPAAVDDGSQHARYLLTGKELENPKLSKSLSPSSVVGWPPLRRSHRLAFHTKSPEEQSTSVPDLNEDFKTDAKEVVFENGYHPVKVNMDGTLYGRKVDLNAHNSYETLSQTLEDMFCEEKEARRSKLLDATSEFVLTYEDKDGNRMLVGDVPWRMFLQSVKRLRIMRNYEYTRLGDRKRTIASPTCQEKKTRTGI